MSKIGKSVAVGALLFALVSQSHAASGSWTNAANEPVLYQTNYWYTGAVIPPLSGVPAGAVIYATSIRWGYTSKPSGIETKVCIGSTCGFTSTRLVVSDTYWNGESANQNVQFSFWAPEATTHTFNPPIYPSIQSQVTITYSF